MAGDYERALLAYDEAIKQKPDDEDAWEAKADIFFKLAKYQEALEAYDRLLRLQPYYDDAIWLKKGDTLYCMAKYEDALDAYDESLLRASYADDIKGKAWVGKSMAYIKLGRLSEAEKCLTKVRYIINELQESYDNALDR
jgi:tetratricopeptide (TPR) repeat protein